MNPRNVYAITSVGKRAFVMPCNGEATMEGVPTRNVWAHLGGRQRNTDAPRLFQFRLQDEEKKQSADEKKKEVPQKPVADEKPNEDGGFANRCIIDMYNSGASRMNGGLYALG